MKYIWKKPYVGPFAKAEAEKLAKDLKDVADPEKNDIHDAKIRKRKNQNMFDVIIKTTS